MNSYLDLLDLYEKKKGNNLKRFRDNKITSEIAINNLKIIECKEDIVYSKLEFIDEIFQMGYNASTCVNKFKEKFGESKDNIILLINTLNIKYFTLFGKDKHYKVGEI